MKSSSDNKPSVLSKYKQCSAAAIYIITDVIDENGWHLGWEGQKIPEAIEKVLDIIKRLNTNPKG